MSGSSSRERSEEPRAEGPRKSLADTFVVNNSTNSFIEASSTRSATPVVSSAHAARMPTTSASVASTTTVELRTNNNSIATRSGDDIDAETAALGGEGRAHHSNHGGTSRHAHLAVSDAGSGDEHESDDEEDDAPRQLSVTELQAVANRFDISLQSLVGSIIRTSSSSAALPGTGDTTPEASSPATPGRVPSWRGTARSQRTLPPLEAHSSAPGGAARMRRAASAEFAREPQQHTFVVKLDDRDAADLGALGIATVASSSSRRDLTTSADATAPPTPLASAHASHLARREDDPAAPLLPGVRQKHNSKLSNGSTTVDAMGASVTAPSDGARKSGKDSGRRGVSFAPPSELNRVTAYEVDNSIYISIEYSRPVIGWVILLVAAMLAVAESVVGSYRNATGVNPFVAATWNAVGEVIIAVLVGIAFFTFQSMSSREFGFLWSRNGALLILMTGVIHCFIGIAHQATIHLTSEWRYFAFTGVHPLIITMYGKVFKNTVFLNEVIGTTGLLIGYTLAMLPSDILAPSFWFAFLLAFSQGIYTASFLFMCTKVRAKVPIPIIFFVLAVTSCILHFIICGASHATINFGSEGGNAVFAFAHGTPRTLWLIASSSSSLSLLCYLLALKFLPPVTVSAVMVLVPLVSEIVSFLLLYNPSTAVWPVGIAGPSPTSLPWEQSGAGPAEGGGDSPWYGLPTPAPTGHSPATLHRSVYTIYFSIGAPLSALAAGYIVYVSSIKRAKVDMLVKSLNRRRRPKNPYTPRGSGGGGATDAPEGSGPLLGDGSEPRAAFDVDPRCVATALAREQNAAGRQRRRELGQRALEGISGGGGGRVGSRRTPDSIGPFDRAAADGIIGVPPLAHHHQTGSFGDASGGAAVLGGGGHSTPVAASGLRGRTGSIPTSPPRLSSDDTEALSSAGSSAQSLDAYYDEM